MKKKKMLLIGGLAFIGLLPRVVHANTFGISLDGCETGQKILKVGDTWSLQADPDVSVLEDMSLYSPKEWVVLDESNTISPKSDISSYIGKDSFDFEATSVGKSTIKFVYNFDGTEDVQVCEILTVDPYIKSVTLSAGKVDFSREKTLYEFSVPNTVEKIKIDAVLSDPVNASFVDGYAPGEKELSVGTNTYTLKTTENQSGESMVYTFKIIREEPKVSLSKLVEQLKKSETAQTYYDNSEQMKLDIEEVSDGIKISVTNLESNQTGSSNFKYEKGILSLVPAGTDGDFSAILLDFLWSGEILNAVANIQGLPTNKINGWLKSLNIVDLNDCTLENAGFELILADDLENSLGLVNSFKIDLANGLKIDPDKIDEYEVDKEEEKNDGTTDNKNTNTTPENKDEVTNPSTGDLNVFAVTAFILTVFSLAGLSIYKIRKN